MNGFAPQESVYCGQCSAPPDGASNDNPGTGHDLGFRDASPLTPPDTNNNKNDVLGESSSKFLSMSGDVSRGHTTLLDDRHRILEPPIADDRAAGGGAGRAQEGVTQGWGVDPLGLGGARAKVPPTVLPRAMLARPTYLRIPVVHLVRFMVTVLLVAFGTCLSTAWVMYGKDIMHVPCPRTMEYPPNFMPTISATISPSPQKFVWRFSVASVTWIDIMLVFAYFALFRDRLQFVAPARRPWCRLLNVVLLLLHLLEVGGKLTTSYIANRELFFWHANGTMSWLVFSILQMPLHVLLFRLSRPPPNLLDHGHFPLEMKSYRTKRNIVILDCIFETIMITALCLHEALCFPYANTVFCFFEYHIYVLTVAFLYTGVYDFQGLAFFVGKGLVIYPENGARNGKRPLLN